MMYGLLNITDGTTSVDFLRGPFRLREWSPRITQPKNDGTWRDSPMADGRSLVNRHYTNVQELFTLDVVADQEDVMIRIVQDLRRLLEKMVAYSTTDWQTGAVWLEVRGLHETNTRYTILRNWSTLQDQNPYSHAFIKGALSGVVMPVWELTLEREPFWTSDEPGSGTCVQLSDQYTPPYELIDYPTQSTDDAWVSHAAGGAINLALGNLSMGDVTVFGELDLGIRFRTVDIPNGATIENAFIRFVGQQNYSNVCNVDIIGEDDAAPAVFGTYANFVGRVRTTASVDWDNVPSVVIGTTYDTPDISSIVQEIVDLGGWASGNNMAIFMENDSSPLGGRRDWASWDNVTYDEPELHIRYTDGTYGRSATCDNEVFAANRHNEAALTHIYVDTAGVIAANLLAGNPPYDLLPAVPAANDAVYFGCDTTIVPSGTFPNLIFNLTPAFTGTTSIGEWEWWDGVAWVTITYQDHTRDLNEPGVNGVFWDFNNAGAVNRWTAADLNAVLGYGPAITAFWIRFRVTGAAGIASVPRQITRHVYTVIEPELDLAATQVVGDVLALTRLIINNWSGAASDTGDPPLQTKRLYVARRSVSRGNSFQMFLNAADEQNPIGLTVTAPGAVSTFANDDYSATGRCILYNPAGVLALTQQASFEFIPSLAQHFFGDHRLFMRVRQVGGAAGDITTQLLAHFGQANDPYYRSEEIAVSPIPAVADQDWWMPIDFGLVHIAPPRLLSGDDSASILTFDVHLSNSNAAPGDLRIMDLALIPVDEWACETYARENVFRPGSNNYEFRSADLDAIRYPKNRRRAFMRRFFPGSIYDQMIDTFLVLRTNGDFTLQSNTAQRLYFFSTHEMSSGGNTIVTSDPNVTVSAQAWRTDRYFSARGAR